MLGFTILQITPTKELQNWTYEAADHVLTAKEVRYWVGMRVVYEPGKMLVLGSLWVGLTGMIITMIGRIFYQNRTPKGSILETRQN